MGTKRTDHMLVNYVSIDTLGEIDAYCVRPEDTNHTYCEYARVTTVEEAEEWHREHLLEVR